MPRFVVLRHDSPAGLHWDFMLEMGQALRSWALPQPPQPGAVLSCRALPDHRLAYLDYEGPVSGARGTVTRWDQGIYELRRQTAGEWVVDLSGQKLIGRATLERSSDDPDGWRFSLAGQ